MPVNVQIRSLFLPAKLLTPAVQKIRYTCEDAAKAKATELWGDVAVTIRDLNALDMAYANNIFTETSSATVNAWNAMAFGAFTVARNTVIGIYGLLVQVIHDGTIDFPPITGVRFDVGGARVAQWHIQSSDSYSSAANLSPTHALPTLTESPIVIGEDIAVTISEYTRTVSTVYVPVWLGVTIEKLGVTLRP